MNEKDEEAELENHQGDVSVAYSLPGARGQEVQYCRNQKHDVNYLYFFSPRLLEIIKLSQGM
jgi:hypothetical protein